MGTPGPSSSWQRRLLLAAPAQALVAKTAYVDRRRPARCRPAPTGTRCAAEQRRQLGRSDRWPMPMPPPGLNHLFGVGVGGVGGGVGRPSLMFSSSVSSPLQPRRALAPLHNDTSERLRYCTPPTMLDVMRAASLCRVGADFTYQTVVPSAVTASGSRCASQYSTRHMSGGLSPNPVSPYLSIRC
jgi:hypothetical protein